MKLVSKRAITTTMKIAAIAIVIIVIAIAGVALYLYQPGPAAPKTVKLGMLAPMSGFGAGTGLEMRYTAEWWAEYVAEEYDFEVEWVWGDNRGDITEAVSVVERLCTMEKVSAIVGPWYSTVGVAVRKVITRLETPMIAVGATSHDMISPPYEYQWRVSHDTDQQGGAVCWGVKNLMWPLWKDTVGDVKFKCYGAIADHDYARSILKGCKTWLAENFPDGHEWLGEVIYPVPAVDLYSELSVVKASGANVVFVFPGSLAQFGVAVNQMRELDVKAMMVGFAGEASSPDFVKLTEDNRWYCMYYGYFSPTLPHTEQTLQWVADWKENVGDKHGWDYPSGTSPMCWEACEAVRHAILLAESTDPKEIQKAFMSGDVTFTGPRTEDLRFSPVTHDLEKFTTVLFQYQPTGPGSGQVVVAGRIGEGWETGKEADLVLDPAMLP